MRLSRKFFNRPTVAVAKELLGKYLCRRIAGKVIRAKITETEAYCGTKDLACHASKGLTPRTKIMFGPPGYAYVYMIYGMYHCLNIVTERKNYPAAVLIRSCELINPKHEILNPKQNPKILNSKSSNVCPDCFAIEDPRFANANRENFGNSNFEFVSNFGIRISNLKLNGPGILCRELKIDRRLNGVDICKSRELWIEDGESINPSQIKKGKRIGVGYAGKWRDKMWRFWYN
ncbi:MAG: DNA-3-methyladenine glycosylase [Candidatus Taylorbacteria bacterium]|nr:DNA-3-methyladenine glycosylase [Candidatus Taylorbacteria bacterium]